MSEPLQDFVARYEWRFVPSARDAATDIQGEVVGGAPARGTRAGNDGNVGNGAQSGHGTVLDPDVGVQRPTTTTNTAVDQAPNVAVEQRGLGHDGQIVHAPGQPSVVVQPGVPRGNVRGRGGQDGQQSQYQVQQPPQGKNQRGQGNTRGGWRAGRGQGNTDHPPATHLQPGPLGDDGGTRGIDRGGLRAVQENRRGRGRGQVNFQEGPMSGGGRSQENTQPWYGQSGPTGGRGFARGRGIINPPPADQAGSQVSHAQGRGTTRGGHQGPRGGRGGGRGNAQQAPTTTNPAPPAPQQQGALNLQGSPPVQAPQAQPLNLTGNPRNRPWAERWLIRQMRRREIDALDVDAAWFSSEFTNLRTQQPLPVTLPSAAQETRTPVTGLLDPAVVAPPAEVESSSMPAENDLFEPEESGVRVEIWNLVPRYRRL